MIHSSFALTPKEIIEFEELKRSVAYREYVKAILDSPVFMKIAQKNLDDIDVKSDLEKLMDDAKHTPSELNRLFKKAMSKMAIGIVADTVILKELADVKIEEVRSEMSDDFRISYLLGLAEDRYYKQAEERLKKDPNKDSILYRGLIEYYKRTGELEEKKKDEFDLIGSPTSKEKDKETKTSRTSEKAPSREFNIEGSDVRI